MKKSQEIIGSLVISIADGTQIGTVKSLVINPQQKNVEFLLLDEAGSGPELRGLPLLAAEGFGEYAITVENESVLIDMSKIGALSELVQQGLNVTGKKIISKKGMYLGDVTEFSVDTSSGALVNIYYGTGAEAEKTLPAQDVITIGKEVLIVEETTPAPGAQPVEQPAQPAKAPSLNFFKGDERLPESGAPQREEKTEEEKSPPLEEKPPAVEAKEPVPLSEEKSDPDPADVFIQRQREYLIGKTLLKDIQTETGEVIAAQNEVITRELFDRVHSLGAQKLMELALSVREK